MVKSWWKMMKINQFHGKSLDFIKESSKNPKFLSTNPKFLSKNISLKHACAGKEQRHGWVPRVLFSYSVRWHSNSMDWFVLVQYFLHGPFEASLSRTHAGGWTRVRFRVRFGILHAGNSTTRSKAIIHVRLGRNLQFGDGLNFLSQWAYVVKKTKIFCMSDFPQW